MKFLKSTENKVLIFVNKKYVIRDYEQYLEL